MGDTFIGVQGKKCRVSSQGMKNATPNPPFVNASNIPWEAVQSEKNTKYLIPPNKVKLCLKKVNVTNMPIIKANNNECVKPR